MASEREINEGGTCEIRVAAHLDSSWSQWFVGWRNTREGENTTVLTGPVADQFALHGVPVQARNLGLTLVSVKWVKPNEREVPEELI